jgi:hypothetical protein
MLTYAFWLKADDLPPLLITPGYGISDYFQLMPDKVETNLRTFHGLPSFQTNKFDASIRGRNLVFAVDNLIKEGTINILTTSGKAIFTYALKNYGCNKIAVAIPPNFPTGIYILSLKSRGSLDCHKLLIYKR